MKIEIYVNGSQPLVNALNALAASLSKTRL